jgi:hypothetical protein
MLINLVEHAKSMIPDMCRSSGGNFGKRVKLKTNEWRKRFCRVQSLGVKFELEYDGNSDKQPERSSEG